MDMLRVQFTNIMCLMCLLYTSFDHGFMLRTRDTDVNLDIHLSVFMVKIIYLIPKYNDFYVVRKYLLCLWYSLRVIS